jgi:Ca2+-binding RTX toxin-like protein
MAVITGTSGDDVLNGTPQDDSIDGLEGADSMTGGNGNDTYYLDNGNDLVIEESGGGVDTVIVGEGDWGWQGYILAAHVENGTLAGEGPQSLTGNGLNNVLIGHESWWCNMYGEGGNDTLIARNPNEDFSSSSLFGGEGNDSLYGSDSASDYLEGGEGRDYMEGGGGGDSYHVDHTGDVVVELAGNGRDQVSTALTNYTLPDNVEDLYFDLDNAQLGATGYGNARDNNIVGRAGADRLYGLDGNDYLNGDYDDDRLYGGAGNDTLIGKRHNDQLYGGDGNDDLSGGEDKDELYGDAGDDDLSGGGGADRLEGGAGNDVLNGNSFKDILLGGDGDDQLRGGDGADTLTGGAGIDRFTFTAPYSGADTITDYDADLEKIVLDLGDGFGALDYPGMLDAQYFYAAAGAAAVAQTADHRIIYDTSSGSLYYDYDGVGGYDQELFVTLNIVNGTFDYNDIKVVA